MREQPSDANLRLDEIRCAKPTLNQAAAPGADGFGGVAPQGYLAASEGVLLVPTGRSVPAAFDRRTGRYTLYTGEPIYTGFMRLAPGPTWWAIVYVTLTILQLGWPALALTSAATM